MSAPMAVAFVRATHGDHPGYETFTAALEEGQKAVGLELPTEVWMALGSPKTLWVTLSPRRP